MLAALVLAVAAGGVEAYRGYLTVRDVQQGRDDLRAGQDVLETRRLDATAEDLAAARGRFDAARREFAAAGSRMRRDPVLWIARRLPLVGGQGDAAVALSEIGESAARIGSEGVDAADAFDAVRAEGDATLPERTMVIFERVDPHIADIERQLVEVDERRAGIGSGRLLPAMGAAVDELDDRRERLREFLDLYRRARAFAPEFLGFDGPKTYVVLAQNEAELLPTGGLVSVVGTLRLDQGRIEELEFRDAVQFGQDWMDRTGDYLEPPRPLKQYLLKDMSWNLVVSNWSPDFPTSARAAQGFYERGGGVPGDGVIAINVRTLERLLEVTGPVQVPEFGVTVDSANAFDLTEQLTRAPYEPQADRKEFVALLADEVLGRVLRPSPGMWSPLVDAVQDLGREKHMLLYAIDPAQQELIREFGWDGEVEYAGAGDHFMLVDASVQSTKLNAVIEQSVDLDVQLDETGAARTTVTVDYYNNLAPWESGREPELVRKLMLGGQYGGYVRLYVPPGSTILAVRDASGEVGLEELAREQGLTVFGRFFSMQRDTRQRLVFEYGTPPVVADDGGHWTYRLALRKQPGQMAGHVRLRVRAPDGMRREAVFVDGERRDAAEQIDVDLSTDREVTFRFARG